MEVFIDTYEPSFFQENIQDSIVKPLGVGDFHLVFEDGRVIVIERKTWDDAYNSWMSKRLELQISQMVENYDDYILLIEGSKSGSRLFRTKKYSQLEGLQTFLNRMSLEVIPVVYTSSKKKTVSYFEYLEKRVSSGDFKTMVRKTKLMNSSRNSYHNILSMIPNISIDRSKQIYDSYSSLYDFVLNAEKLGELDSENKRWVNATGKIHQFIHESWGETSDERELIRDRNEKV